MEFVFTKQIGVIAPIYKETKLNDSCVSVSTILALSSEEQSKFKGVVVCDGADWVATRHKIPLEEAEVVYSSSKDSDVVGCWKRRERTFFLMVLVNKTLQTNKLIKLKEEQKMDLQSKVNNSLGERMNELKGAAIPDLNLMEIDGDGGVKTDTVSKSAKGEKEPTELELETRALKERAKKSNININDSCVQYNRRFGHLISFITKTDPAVKLSFANTQLKGADGKVIPTADATEEERKRAKAGERIPASKTQREKNFQFTQSKPGTTVGVIIQTPQTSYMDFSLIQAKQSDREIDTNNKDMITHILPKEDAYMFIAYNYGGAIKESESLLGNQAGEIVVTSTIKQKDDISDVKIIKNNFKLANKETRKSLCTDGNFIPLKVFRTVDAQDLNDETKETINLSVEALVESYNKKKDNNIALSEEAKKLFKVEKDGSYSSVWSEGKEAITVAAYYNKEVTVSNVKLPIRKKELTKDGKNHKYVYDYATLEDVDGPLSMPLYQEILKNANVSIEDFKVKAKELNVRGKSSKTKDTISSKEVLATLFDNNYSVDNGSTFSEISTRISNGTF